MEPNELMLNDWVYLNSDKEEARGNYKVAFIHTGEIGIERYRDKKTVTFPYLNPVSLTEKILEANKFLQINHVWCNCSFFVVIEKGVMYINVSGYKKEIKYVHELQHALRICGLRKIADEFVVN